MGIVGITVGTTTRGRVLLVVALTLAFTFLSLEVVPPPDTPTEMWASHAGAFIWTLLVWDGRSRPSTEVVAHLAAQLLVFLGIALIFGWQPLDALWMGVTNIGAGVLLVAVWARVRRSDSPAPEDPLSHLLLLLSSAAVAAVLALLGGYPQLEIGELERITLWWVIRGTVYAYVAGVTLVLIFFGTRESPAPAPRWAVAALLPLGVACVWVTYLDPELPLTWFLMLPALAAGSLLTPRGAAVYALFVATLGALATLLPINQFGYDGFLPGSVIIDLLITVSTFVMIHLAILRQQRATATAELERQRTSAEEQALLLGTVFETMNDGLVVLGPDHAVMLHNGAARQLMGRPIPVGRPQDWVDYFGLRAPDGRPLGATELAWGQGGTWQGELRTDERLLTVTSWPLRDRGGRTVVLFADVTSERERLSELTGFAGVVAHDLRSPLSSLHGWLEMAEDSLDLGDPARVGDFLARAQLASVRMRQVIEDWLAYTVQRDGVLTRATVPLAGMVEEIVASYGAPDRGLAPAFDVEVAHAVEADRVLTKQLLANLIGNSVKYTVEGERPEVAIRSAPDTEEGFVRIEVSDRGVGLPDGEEERVFEEFHRAAAHRDAYAGTGLGLALCRRIVARHGGSISARNNPDRGATFAFTLPAAESHR